jgi:hypothetical protein
MHSWQLVREIAFKETVLLGFNADPYQAFQLICLRIHAFDDQEFNKFTGVKNLYILNKIAIFGLKPLAFKENLHHLKII